MPRRKKELPIRVLDRMYKDKLLPRYMSDDIREIVIKALTGVWLDEWYLRKQLLQYPPQKRKKLVVAPELNKVDWYVINLYLNQPDGEKLLVTKVQDLIKYYFNFTISVPRVRNLRQRAYDMKRGNEV